MASSITLVPTARGTVVNQWSTGNGTALTEDGLVEQESTINEQENFTNFNGYLPQHGVFSGLEIRVKGCWAAAGDIPV